jgi:hypothetical protein
MNNKEIGNEEIASGHWVPETGGEGRHTVAEIAQECPGYKSQVASMPRLNRHEQAEQNG